MDGAVDLRLIVTLAGILFSVAGASAVAKMQIRTILEKLHDVEQRLRQLDQCSDSLVTMLEVERKRGDILAGMSSPENLRRDHMELAAISSAVKQLRKDVDHQMAIHNGRHP